MKKKLLVTSLALSLFLSACAKENTSSTNESNAETHSSSSSTHSSSVQSSPKKKLVFSTSIKLLENGISVDAVLQNQQNESLPLFITSTEIYLFNKEGVQVDYQEFKENKKDIPKRDFVKWNLQTDLGTNYGQYQIKAVAHFVNKNGEKSEKTTKADVSYTNQHNYLYTPKQTRTLVYQNYDGSGQDRVESFLYFDKGYAQALNSTIGGNIIYYTDTSGYYEVYHDTSDKRENLISRITPNKKMLLKLPATKGDTWITNGITYKTIHTDAKVDTAYGTLSHVTVVETYKEQPLRIYYHKNFGMVKIEGQELHTKEDGSTTRGTFQTLVELKSVH